ncbi:MAG TPA: hypothetical protein VFS11_07970 [Gemmatimonadales bacterium]|nr:hypothetical protein [Gemmatimonadales bacterium]
MAAERVSGKRPWSRIAPSAALVALVLAASATGLTNGFAYDDVLIVRDNPQVHSLAQWAYDFVQGYWPREHGGALYRPLTLLLFTFQWLAGGGAPWVFHACNVILYAALTLAVFALGARVLPRPAAWAAAALFAVHPVHVEAVANVVGQAEITTALAVVGGLWLYLYARRGPELRARESIGLLLLLVTAGLLKENGIVLVALLLAAEVTIVVDPRRLSQRVGSLLPTYLLLGLGAALLLLARRAALGALVGEYPALVLGNLGARDRLITMLGIVPEWARLFLWPAHLRADYAPPEFDAATTFGAPQVIGLAMLVTVAWLALAVRRTRPALTFAILWVAIALLPVSNLLVPTGILLAERTLFLPSIGVVLGAGLVASRAWEHLRRTPAPLPHLAMCAFTGLLVLGTVRSARRQPLWLDTPTVLAQLTKDAPLNYRAWLMYGGVLRQRGEVEAARAAMLRAAGLYRHDGRIYEDLGQLVRFRNGCARAVPIFRRSLAIDPGRMDARGRLYVCLLETGDTTGAMAVAAEGARRGEWFFQLVMHTGPRPRQAPGAAPVH